MSSKTIFSHARIFTATSDDIETTADCVLIEEERIAFVGSQEHETIRQARAVGSIEHDLQGKVIAPGFVDGHVHWMQLANARQAIDLSSCQSLDDIRETIRRSASERSEEPRLICKAWHSSKTRGNAWAADLDDLDPRPIVAMSKDQHSAWCSTAAMEEMDVASKPDPVGGKIYRDGTGRPSGLISETAAMQYVWPYEVRFTSRKEKLRRLRETIQAHAHAGYTGACDMAMYEELWDLLNELNRQEPLPIRIAAFWLIMPRTEDENLAQVDRAIELFHQHNSESSPDLRITGIKLIVDGLIETCTASLREPYVNGTHPGPIWPYELLLPVVHRADAAGLQCAFHAIGDGAVRTSIDVLSSLPEQTPSTSTRKERRHRIEHLELTHPDDARRLGQYGIIASIQPIHADPAYNVNWPPFVGHARTLRAFAYQDFASHGARLAIGTDAPTAPIPPLDTIHAGTTLRGVRSRELSKEEDYIHEHFRLGLGQAVRAATVGAAYACFGDGVVGTLEVGKAADFVIMNWDWGLDVLLSAAVEQTWKGGRRTA